MQRVGFSLHGLLNCKSERILWFNLEERNAGGLNLFVNSKNEFLDNLTAEY